MKIFLLIIVFISQVYGNDLHKVEFGFNIGYLKYLNEINQTKNVLNIVKKDGFQDIRVYDPFTKNMTLEDVYSSLKFLSNDFKVLLSISNLPYKRISSKLNKKQLKRNNYTNRYYTHSDYIFVKKFLRKFKKNLKTNNLLNNINIEIWNEPDSKNFFWTDKAQFVELKTIFNDVFKEKQLLCCAFTSNINIIHNYETQKSYGLLESDILSYHLYSKKRGFIPPSKEGAVITEYNLYSYLTETTLLKKINYKKYFKSEFVKLLKYVSKYKITKVYLFKLLDNPKQKGKLGFFNTKGKPKDHYLELLKILKHIENGYIIKEDNNYYLIINKYKQILKIKK